MERKRMKAKALVHFFSFLTLLAYTPVAEACSMLYYRDSVSGKIFVVNNEDYWYDVKPYIQIVPAKKNELGRLWYGWDKFAQGGINEAGLFFDGAVTPKMPTAEGYHDPQGRNVGDELLARCKTVEQAIQFLEQEKIALAEGHMMLGDSTGNAVVLEWNAKGKVMVPIKNGYLIATNFLLSDTSAGNYPCARYESIEKRIKALIDGGQTADLKSVGNTMGAAVQLPSQNKEGKTGGTLYTTFIDLSEMQLMVVVKLDNSKLYRIDMRKEFRSGAKKKIKLT